MNIITSKQARCKECDCEVSMTGAGCFMCLKCRKLVDIYLQEKQWVSKEELLEIVTRNIMDNDELEVNNIHPDYNKAWLIMREQLREGG